MQLDLHDVTIHIRELQAALQAALDRWQPCATPAPEPWNDGYTPTCQLPPDHVGVDHWAQTPIGPCVWSAGRVTLEPAVALYDGGTCGGGCG